MASSTLDFSFTSGVTIFGYWSFWYFQHSVFKRNLSIDDGCVTCLFLWCQFIFWHGTSFLSMNSLEYKLRPLEAILINYFVFLTNSIPRINSLVCFLFSLKRAINSVVTMVTVVLTVEINITAITSTGITG